MPLSITPIHTYSPDNAIDLGQCAVLAYKADGTIATGLENLFGDVMNFQSFRDGDSPGFGVATKASVDGTVTSTGEVILCF